MHACLDVCFVCLSDVQLSMCRLLLYWFHAHLLGDPNCRGNWPTLCAQGQKHHELSFFNVSPLTWMLWKRINAFGEWFLFSQCYCSFLTFLAILHLGKEETKKVGSALLLPTMVAECIHIDEWQHCGYACFLLVCHFTPQSWATAGINILWLMQYFTPQVVCSICSYQELWLHNSILSSQSLLWFPHGVSIC